MSSSQRSTNTEKLVKIGLVLSEITWLESRPLKIKKEETEAKQAARSAGGPSWLNTIVIIHTYNYVIY